jgi:hypothetical protein
MASRQQNQRAPEASNQRLLARCFKVDSIAGENREQARAFLLGSVWAAILTPLLFYLQFGGVHWFTIGFTAFLVALCLLCALGLALQNRTEYHTTVPPKNKLGDKLGGFWLMACAFGPLLGWIVTALSPTATTWRWQYYGRVFLAVVLPLITAVPLLRYVRGKAALIALPLLIVITSLPVLSCLWVIGDLHDGATKATVVFKRDPQTHVLICVSLTAGPTEAACDAARSLGPDTEIEVQWLRHTRRVIAVQPR